MIYRLVLAALCVVLCSAAEARPRVLHCVETGSVMAPRCLGNDFLAGVRSIKVTMRRARHSANLEPRQGRETASQIVPHPAGCPARAFCGCGAAVRVFGSPIRSLWLAANWFRFPRTAPAAGMVAVRKHHVFVLEAHIGGNTWLAYDANSGRHATRVHPRSIAGFIVVNPHGASS